MADLEALHDLIRDYVRRAQSPLAAASGLMGMLAALITRYTSARHAAELLWQMGDKTIEHAPPERGA